MATLTSETRKETAKETADYARLSCRVKSSIKKRAEEAADLLGLSITDFTEEALQAKAEEVFEKHQRVLLSENDFARFVSLIENPEPATPALTAAMQQYQELKKQNPEAGW